MLNRAEELKKEGVSFNKFNIAKDFRTSKRTEFPFLKEVNAHAVCNSARDKLANAFKGFFEKRCGFPKKKSKRQCKDSFSLDGSEIKYENKKVYIPRIGWIRLSELVRFNYSKIIRITVSQKADRWFCSFTLEVEDNRNTETQGKFVGIDLGVKELATLSNGIVIPNLRITKQYEKRLRVLNKQLSRRTKGSKNWWKTCYKLRRLHVKIANVRLDYIHKFTTDICKRYGTVCLEDLNVKGMVKNHKLAKHISDCSFSEIRRQFEYKAWEVKLVGTFFPSSKTCSRCGFVKESLTLNERTFVCENCGFTIDRDLNASINIEKFAVSSTGIKKPVV